MLGMLLAVPVVQLMVLSSAATFEVRGGKLWVVDQDQSSESRALLSRIESSGRFIFAWFSTDWRCQVC